MTISVGGLGSGIDYDSWIEKLVALKQDKIDEVTAKIKTFDKKESALSTLQTDYTALQKAVETFTSALSTEDVFNKKAATSSSTAVTASVTSSSTAQNVSVSVSQLATSTLAKSTYTTASYVDSSTKVSDIAEGAVDTGVFAVYVDGVKHEISVGTGTTDDTLGKITNTIDGIDGITASLSDDGKLTISADSGHTVSVGSSTDTSDFASIMSLTRNSTTGVYASSKSVFDTNTNTSLTGTTFRTETGDPASVWAGKFKINGVEFEVTAEKSLDNIISEINKSSAGVTASWDSNAGTMSLKSKVEGAISIDIEAETTNFTDVMGLTTSDWTTTGEGESITHTLNSTKLNTAAQDLGTNAILKINGTQITSTSNTVTSDVSGITGLTLTLNAETTSDASVKIAQDTTKITEAITTLVDSYNKVMTDTEKATTTDGTLYGESILNSVRSKLRSYISASVDGEDGYKTLASIGITTGPFTTNINAKTSQLVIDKDKLQAALTADPDAVKTLLNGNSTDGTKGVLSKMETVLDDALDVTKGYFTTREKSFEKQESRLSQKVTKMTEAMNKYQEQLEKKFALMDEIISSAKKSASVFDSYFNKQTDSKS